MDRIRVTVESDEGDGTIIRGRSMPAKQEGRHRWVAIASYHCPTGRPRRSSLVRLDHENRLDVTVGCFDCEQPYPVVAGQPCRIAWAPEATP
jgi:hypothetical protein